MRKFLLALTLAATMLMPATAFAADAFDPFGQACDGLTSAQRQASASCVENETGKTDNPVSGEDGIIITVANLLAIVTAIIAVIVIVIAGITMTLSGGDSTKIQNSRNAIIYAAVGIAVVGLARTVVVFVVNRS